MNKLSTYLGPKGFTIKKSELSITLQNKIKDDLTVKPHTHGCPATGDQKMYSVYRESTGKIYVPLYYGIKHFDNPKEIKINTGTSINLTFNGTLREKQTNVVDTYMSHINNGNKPFGGGLLELPCAFGKTVLALNIISSVKRKTLIIVHKEFLMNQWIERIEQFLPEAKIGKIQGQIIDIDNKDIVIGMLQSLSMKEYPSYVFESFGLTVIDEVHHISSETFSKSLFKIVTTYTLGLSATMNRKDGTTKVFKMFLGDVIFKGGRDEERDVTVRAIEYLSHDEEFDEVKMDYRGNPAYSSMISKLCQYNRRSEFMLTVLVDLLEENNKQQIIILAHNKNLLNYLYDAIEHRNICTVGYYLGGMKESALKLSETKQVVIATYAMAAEALDIKTLTTLIMATPKTDIQQSVGRILREKHSQPIVVDIVDHHDLFKNQWRKRKTFYKKEKYKILYTTSDSYKRGTDNWKILNDPKSIINSKSHKNNFNNDCDNDIDEKKDTFSSGKCFLKFKINKKDEK